MHREEVCRFTASLAISPAPLIWVPCRRKVITVRVPPRTVRVQAATSLSAGKEQHTPAGKLIDEPYIFQADVYAVGLFNETAHAKNDS